MKYKLKMTSLMTKNSQKITPLNSFVKMTQKLNIIINNNNAVTEWN